MADKPPTPPKGTGTCGRQLWRDVHAKYVLERPDEMRLLTEAARTVDIVDELAAKVAVEGVTVDGKVNPCVVELRHQRLALARLLAALRLPDDEGDQGDQAGRRRQRRAVRGVYSLGLGGAS